MQTLHQIFHLQEFTFLYQFVSAGTSAICFYKSYEKNHKNERSTITNVQKDILKVVKYKFTRRNVSC
jgi:hypothetical protein